MVSSSSSIGFLDQCSNQVGASPPPSFSKRNNTITVTPRCSKAQMCLHKILHIITSHQHQQQQQQERSIGPNGLELMNDGGVLVHKDKNFMCSSEKRLLGIDLNLRLGCLFDESTTIEKSGTSSQGECEPKLVVEEEVKDRDFNGEDHNSDVDGEEEVKKEETTDDHSEITNLQFQSSEKNQNENLENGQCQKHEKSETLGENLKNEGFLGLLVEAARWVSKSYCDDDGGGGGGESDDKSRQEEEEEEDEEESQGQGRVRVRGGGGGRGIEKGGGRSGQKCNKSKIQGSKRKVGCDNNVDVNVYVVEYKDDCKSPVVRSKRGRSQVLPVRYRDSVLEPWKKGFSRPPPRVVAAGCNNKRKSR